MKQETDEYNGSIGPLVKEGPSDKIANVSQVSLHLEIDVGLFFRRYLTKLD